MLKTAGGKWLQDKDKKKDFFFSMSAGGMSTPAGNIVSAPAVASAPAPTPSKPSPSAMAGRTLTQEERNRSELPDITKGVPWLPHQAPVIAPTEPQQAWDAKEVNLVSSNKWSIPAALVGTANESQIKVWP